MSAADELSRRPINLTLIVKASADLTELETLTGATEVEAVNRAVTLYAYVARQWALGHDVLVRNNETGQVDKITATYTTAGEGT